MLHATQTAPSPARLKRAQELIGKGRVSQSRLTPTTYHVSALDNRHAYVVQLEDPSPCTCPDAFYRRVHCKHYLAAALIQLAASAAREEQVIKSQAAQRTRSTLRRAAPRRGRPIWYEATSGRSPVRCADCGRSDCRGSYKPDGSHSLAF